MKLGIIGIAASVVAARTYTAVSRDLRTEIYSDIVAPEVKKGIIAGGNYLWNKEIDGVQKTVGVVEFDNAGDGIEEVWEAKEDKNWQLVKHTDWHTYYKEKFGKK